jgi:uncharacterized protein YfeS
MDLREIACKAWLGVDAMVYCEYSNKPFGSIKGGKILHHLSDYLISRKGSAPQN